MWALSAACARLLLVVLGVGERLWHRLEFSSPFSRLAGVREGLALAQHGLSPYAGAQQ